MIAFIARVLLLFAVARSALGENFVFTLRESVDYALQQVPALASKKREKEISELGLRTAQFSFFPKSNLSADSEITVTQPKWPLVWTSSLGLNISQPILNHSINGINYEIAHTKDDVARLDLEIERDRLCMKVAKDFYNYSAVVEQMAIKTQKLQVLLQQFDVVTRRFHQGFKTQRDVLRFEAQVEQAKIQQAMAKNRVLESKEQLITTITGKNRQELSDTFDFIAVKPSSPTVEAIPNDEPPIEHHPLFKKLQLEQKIASLDVDLSRRRLWPELSLLASASTNAHVGLARAPLFNQSSAFMIGFTLQYELFDFGKSRRDIAVASKKEEIKANSIKTELSHETDVIAKMRVSFALLKESLLLNKKLLALEEDNFKKIQNDYLRGKAQYLDVISALNNLSDVKSTLISSIYDLEAQLITYRYYKGTLYDWIF